MIAAISCAAQPASTAALAQPVEDATLQQADDIASGAESAAEIINVAAPAVLGGQQVEMADGGGGDDALQLTGALLRRFNHFCRSERSNHFVGKTPLSCRFPKK